jgi:hypothetical protein
VGGYSRVSNMSNIDKIVYSTNQKEIQQEIQRNIQQEIQQEIEREIESRWDNNCNW